MTVDDSTIMLIHGAWMNSSCWDKFNDFFTNAGYKCIAPSWPYKNDTVERLRKNPSKELGKLKIEEIVDFYENKLKNLEKQPILVGHSYGGLFVQILLDRGYGSMGVAIHPAPPKGVLPFYFTVIRANFHILRNPLKSRRVIRISPKDFNYAFLNIIDTESQKEIYEKYVVPESGRIFYQSAFTMLNSASKVNFKNNARSPLLIIAGTGDNIVPQKMVHKNYKKYYKSNSITDYLEFQDRCHWTIGQIGWEEVAESIINWIAKQLPVRNVIVKA